MGQFADLINPATNMTLGYAEALLKNVEPRQFARLAAPAGVVVHSNHAAWNYGHLAIYPARCFELLGRPGGAPPIPAAWHDLFKDGTACHDDVEGTIYPAMGDVTKAFFDGYRAVMAAMAEAPDAAFTRQNPTEGRSRERFPTVGALLAFLTSGHLQMHLGQTSAWRRMMGLGSAN